MSEADPATEKRKSAKPEYITPASRLRLHMLAGNMARLVLMSGSFVDLGRMVSCHARYDALGLSYRILVSAFSQARTVSQARSLSYIVDEWYMESETSPARLEQVLLGEYAVANRLGDQVSIDRCLTRVLLLQELGRIRPDFNPT